ncbi:hypothetical protein RFI_15594 [Reticulomyxa filosa]|uniref:Uncharacterized protein n=1 Tax=Reticulomyxa filosa TaxID=46433 RepID=X6N5Q0_RETFI|nr:hypothetical protein RFI_15594 [Reticulomyxa filosa]|eukprot:ETO21610.1 hypothetical protein RFI_15594 [Reticulomyxa filosa]
MYPKFLQFVHVSPNGSYDISKPTVQAFPQESKWQDVVSFFEGTPEGEESTIPKVHIWMQFGHVKQLYPIATQRGVKVTLEDLKDEDPTRYVEIPDDRLSHGVNELELPKDAVILIEKKREEQNKTSESNENDSDDETTADEQNKQEKTATAENATSEEEEKFLWPLIKGPDKWKNFQPGDILDGQVRFEINK